MAFMTTNLTSGFNRLWSEVMFKVSPTLWDSGEPDPDIGPIPFSVEIGTAEGHVIKAGLGIGTGTDPQKYRFLSEVDSVQATGTWYGDDSYLTKADLQLSYSTEFHSWATLVERFKGTSPDDGERVRVRGWLDKVLVLDQTHTPATVCDFFMTWTLTVDPLVAGNDIWIGDISLWDAERMPDPYKIVLLWADGLDDTGGADRDTYSDVFNHSGLPSPFVYAGLPETGFGFITSKSSGAGGAYLQKDLIEDQHEIGIHMWFGLFDTPAADYEILGWWYNDAESYIDSATGNVIHPPDSRAGRLVLTTSRTIQLQHYEAADNPHSGNANTVVTTGWTNPQNAYNRDVSAFATATPALSSSITSDFGFGEFTAEELPDDAVIDGITIKAFVKASVSASTGSVFGLQVNNDGTLLGSETTFNPTTGIQERDKTELSGVTVADLRTPNKVKARVRGSRGTGVAITWSLDNVQLQVSWHIGPTVIGESTALVDLETDFTNPDRWHHYYANVGFGNSQGFLWIKKDGEDFWMPGNIQTTHSDGDVCSDVTFGATDSDPNADDWDMDDLVISKGVEFRLAQVEMLPPNTDDRRLAFNFGSDNFATVPVFETPTDYTFNGQFEPPWQVIWSGQGLETDEDGSMIFIDGNVPAAGNVAVFDFPKLPDEGCGGLVAAVVPFISARKAAPPSDFTILVPHAGLVPDFEGGTAFSLFTRPQENDVDYFSDLLLGLRNTLRPDGNEYWNLGFKVFGADFWYWPINPATGDQWDPTKLPGLGVRGEDCHPWVTEYVMKVILVRPSNITAVIEEAAFWPRKNLIWRPVDLEHTKVRKNLAWRQPLHGWQRKNLKWEPLPEGTQTIAPYCPDGHQPQPLIDNFENNRVNTRIWSPFWDTGSVLDPNGRTQGDITITNSGTAEFTGQSSLALLNIFATYLFSNTQYDFTDGWVQIKAVSPCSGETHRFMGLRVSVGANRLFGPSGIDDVEIRWRNFQLEAVHWDNDPGSETILASLLNSLSEPEYWRIRHDSASASIIFEISYDAETYFTLYTLTGQDPDVFKSAGFQIYVGNLPSPIPGPAGSVNNVIQPGVFASLLTSPVLHW